MIISRTPFRISFFGGGTDFPKWYEQKSGKVIATTIDKYCYISVRKLPPFFHYNYRLRYFKTELVKSLNQINHPSIRESLKYLKIADPMEILHSADLPAQSGLGASSSFTVGLLNALNAYQKKHISKKQLGIDAIDIEQNWIKEAVGSQDQISAAFGGFNVINFFKKKIEIKQVITKDKILKDLEDSIFLFFTGYPRKAKVLEKNKIKNIKKSFNYYNQIADISLKAEEKLYSSKNIVSDFSELMLKYWSLKKKLGTNVTNEEIEKLINLGIKNGAHAGKLVGAGGGGFCMFLIDPKKRDHLIDVFKNFTIVPIKFENTGSQIIYYKSDYDKS